MTHELPTLPYAYDALEPYIDATTMHIHHTKHHATYVQKLNEALVSYPELQQKEVEQLLKEYDSLPQQVQTAVRNHGGGHANHSLFWSILKKDVEPSPAFLQVLQDAFGGEFTTLFTQAALGQFGSGWAWLVYTKDKKLAIYSTPNQDSPFMRGDTPLLGVDVWEHAYYLKYQQKRPEYVQAFLKSINWQEVEKRYIQVKA